MAEYNYVRIALQEDEFDRLLTLLDHVENEPVVLKLRAKRLSHQANRINKADLATTPKRKRTRVA